MSNDVEEIKTRLNIVDVVGEYVRLTKAGTNWKANCPFHNEKSPSFMVNEEKQIFHCFGCNKGGDIFTFVQEIESLDFRETIKLLAEKAGVQLSSFNPKAQEGKSKVLDALESVTKFYEKQLWDGPEKDKILGYLFDRGLSSESIRRFRLGYAPAGWDNTLKFLSGKGFSVDDMLGAGLIIDKGTSASRYYDRFRDRIMFPVQDSMGKVIGFSARVAPGGDESQAKYINTPETGVYHKGRALYGIFQAKQEIKNKNCTLLVEGNLDVIASHQAGLGNTVAVSGTALTEQQLDILKRYSENIKMFFDMDSAGQNAAQKSAQLCYEKGFAPSIVSIEEGKDAADLAAKDPQKLVQMVSEAIPAIEYFIKYFSKHNDKDTAEGKKVIAKGVGSIISHISNKIEKAHWISKLAQDLEVEERDLSDVLTSAKPRNQVVSASSGLQQETRGFVKRADVIGEKIAGILLADSVIWREISENEDLTKELSGSTVLNFILREGHKVEYSYENMLMRINDGARERFGRMRFDGKFKFAENEVNEFSHEDLLKMLESYLEQYRKELLKDKLDAIIRDIKKAETSGDKETLVVLMNELSKISSQLK